ncbi:MAG: TIGR02996 domain-containing protein, partial [Myxococcota bacterium]|nr:TIGR02996 domain-containing protein [Myxococcota bacterium]
LAAGRTSAGIEQLLVAWRQIRAPAIADAIDRATRLLPSFDRPLAPMIAKVQGAWMAAMQRDPSGSLPQLLQYVNVGGAAQSERRLLELAALPDDPRIALRLVELASMRDVPFGRRQYWRSLFELVGRIADVRTCEPLQRLLQGFTLAHLYPHHRQARAHVHDLVLRPPAPPVLGATAAAQLAAVTAVLDDGERVHDRTERDLLAAIAEDRGDDGPYLVYADWLLEREHPRGTLIILACKRHRTNPETTRYVQLEDLPYVFGYLYDFVRRPQLERGLPRQLYASPTAGTLTWRTAARLPLMSLIETLQLRPEVVDVPIQQPTPADLAAFVLHPNLARLRVLHDVPTELADAVAPLVTAHFEARVVRTIGGLSLSRLERRS